ncbi:hypothetical protein ACPC3D_12360 [Streptomyces cellulosae]
MEEQLRKLVDRYRGCEQRPVRFRPKTWRARLEAHDAAHVLDVGVACTTGTSGDRLIDRGDLARLRDAVDDDPGSLRDLFVAVMIWGSGTTNGRGPRYADRDTRTRHCPTGGCRTCSGARGKRCGRGT